MPTKILVVDDEPDLELIIRKKFRKKIQEKEFQFDFAQNGVEALEKLQANPEIDLVLSDINMPKMDGLTLLGKLNSFNSILKAVIVSAYGDMKNIRTAMNLGAFDFLTKPIDFEDLEITLHKTRQYVQYLKESLRLRQEKEQAEKKALELELRSQFIRQVFGRYLTDEVVASLLESPEGLKLGGEKRKVSILMSDLRGFTAVSERLAPEQVTTIVNRYLETMISVIMKYRGTIVDFIGDAILVIFGAPLWREDDAQRAIACAVAIQLAMTLVNEQNRGEGLPDVEMGIGVHTGEVIVGNIGSDVRTKYGVVGSSVNLTSRIESCTVGGQILISEATLRDAGSILRVGKQMEIQAKGVEKPMTLYDLQGIEGEYQLFLPEEEATFFPLNQEIPVCYTIVEGKQVNGAMFKGSLVKLSIKGDVIKRGEVSSENPVSSLSNVRMRFTDLQGGEIPGDLYGKVVEELTENKDTANAPTGFSIQFTSIPPEVATFLRELLVR